MTRLFKQLVVGLITDTMEKVGPKATKYGCKVGDMWYGTFSTTKRDIMEEAKKKGENVKIIYEVAMVDGQQKNNIKDITAIWENEVEEKNVPI